MWTRFHGILPSVNMSHSSDFTDALSETGSIDSVPYHAPRPSRPGSFTIKGTDREVLIDGPGELHLEAVTRSSGHATIRHNFAKLVAARLSPQISISLRPVLTDRVVSIQAPFHWTPVEGGPGLIRWEYYILTHGTE